MLPVPCYLYDDFSFRWRNAATNKWVEFEHQLRLKEYTLREFCEQFEDSPIEIIAVADGVRVVNSERLVSECRRRKIPVRPLSAIREVAEREGKLDRCFYSVGFGPGLAWVHG